MATARAAALFLLLVALLTAMLGSAFVLPSARPSSSRAVSRSRLHVLDPASLPDPSTVDAAMTATQQAVVNGPNQIVDAVRTYIFSPSGFGATGLLALGIRMYTYFTVRRRARS